MIIMVMLITPDSVAVLSMAAVVEWPLVTFVVCLVRCYHSGIHLIEFS